MALPAPLVGKRCTDLGLWPLAGVGCRGVFTHPGLSWMTGKALMNPSAFPRSGPSAEARSVSAHRAEQSRPANPTVGSAIPPHGRSRQIRNR